MTLIENGNLTMENTEQTRRFQVEKAPITIRDITQTADADLYIQVGHLEAHPQLI